MYVAAGVVGMVCLILGVASRKEEVDFETVKISGVLLPFYRIAIYLYKWTYIHRIPFLASGQAEKDLERLHPGARKNQLFTEYYVSKLAKSLLICVAGTFWGLVISVQSKGAGLFSDTGGVARGTYEEGSKEVEVVCSLPEGMQEFTIEVGVKTFNEEEITQLYQSFCDALPDFILGENSSLQEITQNLYLREAYEGYPFVISWESSNLDVIRSDGVVSDVKEMQDIELRATVSYEEWEWEEILSLKVIPPALSREEQAHLELEELLLASERESRTEAEWRLPDSWEGQELLWTQKSDDFGLVLWMGAMVVAFLVYVLADKDLHDEVEKRKLQMKRKYPDVIHKLVLYLGAGMTIRSALQRMAEEYELAKNMGKMEIPVYEELLHTCWELKAGVSEGAAYEHFGKRTGLQEYIRLTTLLTQNLKKGNSTLLQRLREEAAKASVERIQYAKRLGEEAMTKLLLPMVMMLLVVMLMIMIPAFSSVGT